MKNLFVNPQSKTKFNTSVERSFTNVKKKNNVNYHSKKAMTFQLLCNSSSNHHCTTFNSNNRA